MEIRSDFHHIEGLKLNGIGNKRVRRRGRHLAVGSEMMTESSVMQENEEAHPDSNYIS